ncbi:MAG: VCBS repeat-containing protein, partial [Bacteroidota bacterium]
QMVYIRDSFDFHRDFAITSLKGIFPNNMLDEATILEMNYPLTSLVENKGNGKFELHALPTVAQTAPIFGIQCTDVDGDGLLDVLMIGNDFGMELMMGQCDAFNGLVLKGNGDLTFSPISLEQSGFVVPGDGKSLVQYVSDEQLHFVAGQNKSITKHFVKDIDQQILCFGIGDAYALVQDQEGKTYKVESYYGNGFLSQSGRFFILPNNHKVIEVIQTMQPQ